MSQRQTDKRRITLDLSEDLLTWLDSLKSQLGMRSRGAILEQLLREIQGQGDDDEPDANEPEANEPDDDDADGAASAPEPASELPAEDVQVEPAGAIIPARAELVPRLDQGQVSDEQVKTSGAGGSPPAAGGPAPGIQLPGFVRRQAREIKRSLQAEPRLATPDRALALISNAELLDALNRAEQHWREVYGQPATDTVIDAAIVWLARDVWPQSDHSDGRPFTWNLAQQVLSSIAPDWPEGSPTLERVITAAGILEDPFSGATLAVRVPTLITRFVQRHRSRQKRTTSFEAIDQSMTVHAALRLLQLATVSDRPYTLKEIREAYREQAQCHHPDAGGSADAMRRLNEAYQFLKERYRRTS